MTAIEKRLVLENVNMLSLLGLNDANLRMVEDRFNSSITVRGDNVIIKGVSEEIETIEKIFKEMIYDLNTNNSLKSSDVETILDLTIQGKEIISGK